MKLRFVNDAEFYASLDGTVVDYMAGITNIENNTSIQCIVSGEYIHMDLGYWKVGVWIAKSEETHEIILKQYFIR